MASELIGRARSEGRRALGEIEAKELVAIWGIPVAPTRLATSAAEARERARELGLPAVLKLVSPDVVHKSDVDGVRLALDHEDAVERAFEELKASANAARPAVRFEGVAVQPMAPPGLELLLGAHRDPQFGPVVTFGLGGVLVEVYEDIALRVAPLDEIDAAEMVDEIRAARLLGPFRGRPAIDRDAIERALLSLSELMVATPEVAELDLNPVFAYPTGLLAVDARVILA
ncbi:MAG TPA: acetate--CoA ligase family protein [Chloroflexota bacterium]|nr:acetate--CoA ligase family protein [Chloroflexota bacterium]